MQKIVEPRYFEILRMQKIGGKCLHFWRVQCSCLFLYQPKPCDFGYEWITCPACGGATHVDYKAKIRGSLRKGKPAPTKKNPLYPVHS